jgi:hypothetical protein
MVYLLAETLGLSVDEVLDMPFTRTNQLEHCALVSKGCKVRFAELDKALKAEIQALIT